MKTLLPSKYHDFIKYIEKFSIQNIHSFINQLILKKVNVKLIGLCSSHVNNLSKLEKLQNMLNSWASQVYNTKLILSISYDKELTVETLEKLKNIQQEFGDNIIISTTEEKQTQFEHYKNICDKYTHEFKDYWVYFTDDDDIWSKNRTFIFGMLIQMLIKNKIDDWEMYVEYPFIAEGDVYIDNSIDVAMRIYSGDIKISDGNKELLEYICYSIKFKDFKNFNDVCDIKVLKHDLCDRYFMKYLFGCETVHKIMFKIPFFGFSYYYFNNSNYVKKSKKLILDDETSIIMNISTNIIILYYLHKLTNDTIVKSIINQLNEYKLDTEKRNKIFKKCLELSVNVEYDIYKNSPIFINKKY